jgi:deoxyadenosine/deoxycytidine kinase
MGMTNTEAKAVIQRIPTQVTTPAEPNYHLETRLNTLKTMDHVPFTISIEGIIGAGKSNCLNYLSADENLDIQKEPVELWQNWDGINLLKLFYMDQHMYGHLFQSYVQLTMLQRHFQPVTKSVRVMERSIFSTHYVFQKYLKDTGKIADMEDKMLTHWFNFFTGPQHRMNVDLIVYIKVKPEKALERIQFRNRKEEQTINVHYLKRLEHYYEEWLHYSNSAVLILDGNKDHIDMPEEYHKIRCLIQERLVSV